MKKIHYTVIAALALLSSCSRNADQMVEWTFNAPATKASFSEAGEFSWNAGDRISVWNATSASFVSFTTVTGKGIFRATAPADAHFSQWAYFPESIAKGLETIHIENGTVPMCAKIEEGSDVLHFRHAGALVTIRLKNVPEEAASFVIGSGSTAFTGDFTLTDGVWNVSGNSGSVVMPISAGDFAFSTAVPAGEYSLWYSLKDASGVDIFKRETDVDFNFQRGYSYSFPLENLDSDNSLDINGRIPIESIVITSDTDNWNGLE